MLDNLLSGKECPSWPSASKDDSCGFRMQFGKAGCRSPESTHYNLGDLFTKPFSPARLLTLCYLHGLVNEYDDPVGEKEWEDLQLKHDFKL